VRSSAPTNSGASVYSPNGASLACCHTAHPPEQALNLRAGYDGVGGTVR